jgi:hypothetical protein
LTSQKDLLPLQSERNVFIVKTDAVHHGPVAQLNRASDSGSECRGFESHRGHHKHRQAAIIKRLGDCFYAIDIVKAGMREGTLPPFKQL